jgi:BspA type Leucine rich repeat region (6 copies)
MRRGAARRKGKNMKTQSSITKTANVKTMAGGFKTACAARLLPLLLLLTLPAAVQAQFYYWINNGTITITGYTGSGGAVTIPDTINGLPVTSIGDGAFEFCTSLTSVTTGNSVTNIGQLAFHSCTSLASVTIGNSVTSIGYAAFASCTNLTSVTIPISVTSIGNNAFNQCTRLTSVTLPNSVISIGTLAFSHCSNLTNVTIPNSVISIGYGAFDSCTSLTSVTIPNSVTSIGDYTFGYCTRLTGVYFKGNAPSLTSDVYGVFYGYINATVYYLPGTTGWGPTFGGRPTVLWNPQAQTSGASFGVRTNRFGFTITGTSNLVIVVEACTNLTHPIWSPVRTNTLTGGSSYFSDPQWTNYPGRFYRLRSP